VGIGADAGKRASGRIVIVGEQAEQQMVGVDAVVPERRPGARTAGWLA
jgi:hypothetical protein